MSEEPEQMEANLASQEAWALENRRQYQERLAEHQPDPALTGALCHCERCEAIRIILAKVKEDML